MLCIGNVIIIHNAPNISKVFVPHNLTLLLFLLNFKVNINYIYYYRKSKKPISSSYIYRYKSVFDNVPLKSIY
jgi:hypothetical protein